MPLCVKCKRYIDKTSYRFCPYCGKQQEVDIKEVIGDRWEITLFEKVEVINDRNTGIIWRRHDLEGTFPWQESSELTKGMMFGSSLGWRLPTINELASLVVGCDPEKGGKEKEGPGENGRYWQAGLWICGKKNSTYWSSSKLPHFDRHAYFVSFTNGFIFNDHEMFSHSSRLVLVDLKNR